MNEEPEIERVEMLPISRHAYDEENDNLGRCVWWVVMWEITRNKKQTSWPESVSELYRPSDRRLSVKIVPTFADKGCLMVSVADPYGQILGFLDRNRYFFFQVAPQLYSRGWTSFGTHSISQKIW
jgi:hypothetical protein